MTVDGSDFGFEFSSPISVFVCNQACSQATLISPTSITCLAPPSPQSNYKLLAPVANISCPVTVSVANSSGTFDGNVTFFRPTILLQSVSPQVAGSGVVTVIGSAFGLEDSNPVVRIGQTACAVSVWFFIPAAPNLECFASIHPDCWLQHHNHWVQFWNKSNENSGANQRVAMLISAVGGLKYHQMPCCSMFWGQSNRVNHC